MAALVYPDGLPNPSVSMTFSPEERRLLAARPFEVRPLELGFRGSVKLEFNYTATHAAIFRPWWLTDLARGLKWFQASWPNRFGFTIQTYRFKPDSVQWSQNGFEYYKIDAECYIRGLTLAPQG